VSVERGRGTLRAAATCTSLTYLPVVNNSSLKCAMSYKIE
jgi:hypothetical protein